MFYGHVTDHLKNILCLALMAFEEGLEILDRLLSLTRRGEQYRLVGTIHVDEDGHIVVASL